jgi:hypothetical protein
VYPCTGGGDFKLLPVCCLVAVFTNFHMDNLDCDFLLLPKVTLHWRGSLGV